MSHSYLLIIIFLPYCIDCTTSTSSPDQSLGIRTTPGTTTGDVIVAIKEGLNAAKLHGRGGFTATQRLERSWSGAVLLSVYATTSSRQVPQQIISNLTGTGQAIG